MTYPIWKIPCPKISDTVFSDTDKLDAKNNNLKNNNILKVTNLRKKEAPATGGLFS
jgi:hypothetical protein